jgi:hypothetical protein
LDFGAGGLGTEPAERIEFDSQGTLTFRQPSFTLGPAFSKELAVSTSSADTKPWLVRSDNRFILLAAVWLVAYFGARGLLERSDLDTWVRVTIALAPIPLFAWFLVNFIGMLRAQDELERRIHLEALAIAFPLGILLLQILALMQRAVELRFEDWSYAHVWIYLPIFYFLSLGLVRKRYT